MTGLRRTGTAAVVLLALAALTACGTSTGGGGGGTPSLRSVSGRVDALDSSGAPVAVSYNDRAPGSNTTWAYADLADVNVAEDEDSVGSPFFDAMRGGFPER